MQLRTIVALTGAGISAESGISTFRDSGGLWEQYDVMEVASIQGWIQNASLVQRFYNARREVLKEAQPNQAHLLLAALEQHYHVEIVTQNVDDLHERAGSSHVLHLHGELTKARSEKDPNSIVEIGYRSIADGELAEDGSRLRPHIVWFGEAVPMIEQAADVVHRADLLLIIGTSLNVYPAAGLINYTKRNTPVVLIDPNEVNYQGDNVVEVIRAKASEGMQLLYKRLMEKL